jgi:hypothetical protein
MLSRQRAKKKDDDDDEKIRRQSLRRGCTKGDAGTKRAKAFASRLLVHASRRHDRRRQQTKAASQGLEKLDSRIWRNATGTNE